MAHFPRIGCRDTSDECWPHQGAAEMPVTLLLPPVVSSVIWEAGSCCCCWDLMFSCWNSGSPLFSRVDKECGAQGPAGDTVALVQCSKATSRTSDRQCYVSLAVSRDCPHTAAGPLERAQ